MFIKDRIGEATENIPTRFSLTDLQQKLQRLEEIHQDNTRPTTRLSTFFSSYNRPRVNVASSSPPQSYRASSTQSRPPLRCYGCNELGHGIARCPTTSNQDKTTILNRLKAQRRPQHRPSSSSSTQTSLHQNSRQSRPRDQANSNPNRRNQSNFSKRTRPPRQSETETILLHRRTPIPLLPTPHNRSTKPSSMPYTLSPLNLS